MSVARSFVPPTRHLSMEQVADRINTNSLLREEGGITFASKVGRQHSDRSRSICIHCDKPIRFDGIVWLAHDTNAEVRYRCAKRGKKQKFPHQPLELSQKEIARASVYDLIRRTFQDQDLSLLTMPGVEWDLERRLLDEREGPGLWSRAHLTRTRILGVEKVDAVYRGGCMFMPGRTEGMHAFVPPDYASFAFQTRKATYFRCDVLDALPQVMVDAAWLDFTGPLSIESLDIIEKAWRTRHVGRFLCVTSLKARWNRETSDAIAGDISLWFQARLGRPAKVLAYQDNHSPMHQITWIRP